MCKYSIVNYSNGWLRLIWNQHMSYTSQETEWDKNKFWSTSTSLKFDAFTQLLVDQFWILCLVRKLFNFINWEKRWLFLEWLENLVTYGLSVIAWVTTFSNIFMVIKSRCFFLVSKIKFIGNVFLIWEWHTETRHTLCPILLCKSMFSVLIN